MKELYILIITRNLNFHNEEIPNIPYLEIVSSHIHLSPVMMI